MDIKDFKSKYSKLKTDYDLPKFEELNLDFEIDKIEMESDYLLRSIRKIIMEKIVNSLSFLDMLLNPVNAPRLYQSFIRSLGVEDKNIIDSIHKELSDLSMISLDLEIDSSESKEAELIILTFDKWNKLKPNFRKLISSIRNPKDFVRKERSYFG